MPRKIPTELRYAGAVLAVLLTAATRAALDRYAGDGHPLLAYYPAIALCAWFAGLGPALLATAVGGLSVACLALPTRGSLAVAGAGARIDLAVYALGGLLASLLAWSLRQALLRAAAGEAAARRALEAERLQATRLRTTLASIADAVITADADGRVTGLNRTAEQLTGWPAAEAAGRPLSEVFRTVDGRTRRTDEMPVAAVLEDGAVVRSTVHVMLRSRDGGTRPVEHCTAPIQEDGGPIAGMVLVFRDVAERYRAEQALRDSEERFRQLAENITDAFWVADPRDGRVLYVSPAYEAIYGRPRRRLYEDRRALLEPVHREDRGRVLAAMRGLGAGRGMAEEYRVVWPDGTERWVWDRGFPILDADGRVARVAGIAEDITERKRAEESLREADRRKDEFLATLAHELRNPLAPIAAALELMAGHGGGPEMEADRAMAMRQVRHLARLVEDLMDASRIRRGKLALRKRVVDLAEVVVHAAEAAGPAIGDRGHELTVSAPKEPVRLEADPARLEQVLVNLLGNAAKYTEPGGRIRLSAGREGGQAVIRVEDTGIGIEPSRLSEVFGAFVQLERRLERSRGGLGVGLSLVKGLVELHGGAVEARSRGPGRGSEFVVRLPAPAMAPDVRGPRARAPCPRPAIRPPRRRVLVVDDNVDAAEGLGRLLTSRWGQEVRVAHDGPAALEAAGCFDPEVVLLDLGLPGMDGCEVARELRRRPGSSGALLVAVTGWGQESDRELTRAAGFDHHLVKPVELEALDQMLATTATPVG